MNSACVRLGEYPGEIFVRAVARSGGVVVLHVVACVAEGGLEAGIDPDGVAAEFPDVVQLFDYTVKIAYAVCVGVVEGLGIYFVKYCIIEPFGLLCNTHDRSPLNVLLR